MTNKVDTIKIYKKKSYKKEKEFPEFLTLNFHPEYTAQDIGRDLLLQLKNTNIDIINNEPWVSLQLKKYYGVDINIHRLYVSISLRVLISQLSNI